MSQGGVFNVGEVALDDELMQDINDVRVDDFEGAEVSSPQRVFTRELPTHMS